MYFIVNCFIFVLEHSFSDELLTSDVMKKMMYLFIFLQHFNLTTMKYSFRNLTTVFVIINHLGLLRNMHFFAVKMWSLEFCDIIWLRNESTHTSQSTSEVVTNRGSRKE